MSLPCRSRLGLPLRALWAIYSRRPACLVGRTAMPTETPRILLQISYDKAAEKYLRKLPPEHFMEATPQATQREITVESLAVLKSRVGNIQYFNELLVQYPFEGQVWQVVPDNMLIQASGDALARTSFAVEQEPAPPFLV